MTRVELLSHVRWRHRKNVRTFACPMTDCDATVTTPLLLERHLHEVHENPVVSEINQSNQLNTE